MATFTPDEIRHLLEAAKARDAAAPAKPHQLSVFNATLMAAIAQLTRSGKTATTNDVLTYVLEKTGTIYPVQQTHTVLGKLVTYGLLTSQLVKNPPGTAGKPPQTYQLTEAGAQALKAHSELMTVHARVVAKAVAS
jgi:hypothetical protein